MASGIAELTEVSKNKRKKSIDLLQRQAAKDFAQREKMKEQERLRQRKQKLQERRDKMLVGKGISAMARGICALSKFSRQPLIKKLLKNLDGGHLTLYRCSLPDGGMGPEGYGIYYEASMLLFMDHLEIQFGSEYGSSEEEVTLTFLYEDNFFSHRSQLIKNQSDVVYYQNVVTESDKRWCTSFTSAVEVSYPIASSGSLAAADKKVARWPLYKKERGAIYDYTSYELPGIVLIECDQSNQQLQWFFKKACERELQKLK